MMKEKKAKTKALQAQALPKSPSCAPETTCKAKLC